MKTVKSFDPVQNDCEGIQNLKNNDISSQYIEN
jgi:hypothetical protein